ncbi:MAG: hypothetical protein Fur0011_2410 [Candidatus Microgenomates bacterium]
MKKRDVEDQIIEEEVDKKAEAKAKRKEGVERRKIAKKKDKIARWSGFILLLVVITVGFLLWVAGEMHTTY